MAKTPSFLLHCFLTIIIILVLYIAHVNSKVFTMKLIHPNSLESPFFKANISHEKRIKMLSSQSNMRANYLSKTSSSTIHALVDEQRYHYVVKIGIGTFDSKPPYKEYYLEMDTANSLVWLQCEGCTKCFKQTPISFPKNKSSSFRPIIRQNKLAPYKYNYIDGDKTDGILARETFYLQTEKSELTKIENIQFGCGLYNKMRFWNYENNKIAGIMGLGWEDTSFVQQLGFQIEGKFSYCLTIINSGKTPSTFLKFGDDIIAHDKNTKSTHLYRKRDDSFYYVNMQGISIDKTRLNISPKVFASKNNTSHRSGCAFDTGTPYTRIIKAAFRILKLQLKYYFSRFKSMKRIKGELGLELCYGRIKGEGFKNLHDITFHFEGSQADFVLKAEAAFEVVSKSREFFCLAMVQDNRMSIIGAYQQTNHMIIHDTKNKQLVFYPKDCSKNP